MLAEVMGLADHRMQPAVRLQEFVDQIQLTSIDLHTIMFRLETLRERH